MIYFLHSVGTAIDTETENTHPIRIDGTPDRSADVLVYECCAEWFGRLSEADWQTVREVAR